MATTKFLNFSTRKVGGLRFIKIGRLTLSWSISTKFRPLPTEEEALSRRASTIERNRWRKAGAHYRLWRDSEWEPETYPATLTFIDHE